MQESRSHTYGENMKDESDKKCPKKVIAVDDDTRAIIDFLIDLITAESRQAGVYGGLLVDNERLLEEIEMFFRSTVADDVSKYS